jgi:hypothetical protein
VPALKPEMSEAAAAGPGVRASTAAAIAPAVAKALGSPLNERRSVGRRRPPRRRKGNAAIPTRRPIVPSAGRLLAFDTARPPALQNRRAGSSWAACVLQPAGAVADLTRTERCLPSRQDIAARAPSLFSSGLPGDRAVYVRPLALRARLATGVPFSGFASRCGPALHPWSWSAPMGSGARPPLFSVLCDEPDECCRNPRPRV